MTAPKQWKVTIILDEDPRFPFTADSVVRAAKESIIGHKVLLRNQPGSSLLRDALFEISDVVDAEEYKPIRRSAKPA